MLNREYLPCSPISSCNWKNDLCVRSLINLPKLAWRELGANFEIEVSKLEEVQTVG